MLSDSDSNNSRTDSDPSSVVSDTGSDVYCYESMVPSSTVVTSCIKKKKCWNLATHHLRREIGNHCSREILWIQSAVVVDNRTRRYENAAMKGVRIDDIGRMYKKIKFDIPIDSCGETLWIMYNRVICLIYRDG